MVRVTSVGCFLLVIVFLNLVVPTNACAGNEEACTVASDCCGSFNCCNGYCDAPCRQPGKRVKLREFFRQR
uniref:I2_Vc11.7 prepropeptide n=1 Tax=Conus victoriae TaxID=319920 RepID=W4VSL9_CONVC